MTQRAEIWILRLGTTYLGVPRLFATISGKIQQHLATVGFNSELGQEMTQQADSAAET